MGRILKILGRILKILGRNLRSFRFDGEIELDRTTKFMLIQLLLLPTTS